MLAIASADETSASAFSRGDLGLTAIVACLHLYTRVAPLSMSLTHDEAYTITNYVQHGPIGIYLEPYIVNNHVLFSLLTWFTTQIGGAGEALYRLWSVVPSILAVTWLAVWVHRRYSYASAMALVVLGTAAPLAARYAVLARGYSLALLASVAMLVCTVRHLERRDRRSLQGLGLAGVLGCWAYPLVALLFAAHALVLLCLVPSSRWRVLRLVLVTAGVGMLVLGPVIPALLREALGLSGVPPVYGPEGPGVPLHPATGLLRQLVPGVPRATTGLVAAGALAAYVTLGSVGLASMAPRVRVVLVAPVLALGGFHLLTGVHFAPRFLVPVLLHALLPVAVGVGAACAPRNVGRRLPQLCTLAALGIGAALLTQATMAAAQLDDAPLEDHRGVAAAIARGEGTGPVHTDVPDPVALRYYTGRQVIAEDADALRKRSCGSSPPRVLVLYGADRHIDACLRARGASTESFPQQWAIWPTLYVLEE